ncbi:hypothetical protein P3X46_024749 [Hevea brasiliensis]|uniref:Legume lectin domain-containing protein n=2 Tax=Hevea brasiliensis TaxID=3981 RepID=A0ABQ9L3H7_HEVBR|nr:hypothetical protein P3X46_024749 [Hevea brasiliensis]
MILILFFLLISPATALFFNFTNFNESIRDLKYEGDAHLVNSAIQLTDNLHDLTGHVTYLEPLHLWDKPSGNLSSFTINFTCSIDAQNNASHSDGIALFLAHLDYQIPDIQQGSGIGLASGNQTLSSTDNPFVAVEFDTYHNAWDAEDGDHVGIDVSSLRSSKIMKWDSSLDGRIVDAGIIYNSSSKNLCVYFTGLTEGIFVPQVLCLEIDLRDHLPEWVVVGFSAATGMYSEFHTIHSWSCNSYFSSSPPSSSFSPPPPQCPPKNNKYKALMIAGWSVAGSFLVILLVGGVISFCIFKNRQKKDGSSRDTNRIDTETPGPHHDGGGIEPSPQQDQVDEIENDTPRNQNGGEAGNEPARSQVAGNVGTGADTVLSERIEGQADSAESGVERENDPVRVLNREETQIGSSSVPSIREIGIYSSPVTSEDLC